MRNIRFLHKCVASAALNSVLLGYFIGVMGGASVFIQEDFDLDDWEVELMLASLSLMAIFGALLAGYISDHFGRRRTLTVASLLFSIGALLMAIAPDYIFLLVGRLVMGFGVGTGLSIDPLYISEISPPDIRGELVSWSEFCINIGVVLGFAASFACSGLPTGVAWRVMMIFGGVLPASVTYSSIVIMVESPRWLVRRGRIEEAYCVLLRLQTEGVKQIDPDAKMIARTSVSRILEALREEGEIASFDEHDMIRPDDVKSSEDDRDDADADDDDDEVKCDVKGAALAKVQLSDDEENPDTGEFTTTVRCVRGTNASWRQFLFGTDRDSNVRRRMMIVVLGVSIFQQLTGVEILMYYAPQMLNDSGFENRTQALGINFAMGVLKTLVVFAAAKILDQSYGGRRPMLLVGFFGMMVSNIIMAIGFSVGSVPGLNVFGMFLFVAFFSIGPGPIAWLLCSEILPTTYRAKGMVVACSTNRFCSFVVTMLFLTASDSLSPAHVFGFLAATCALSCLFVVSFVPETKGKSLEEMSAYFRAICTSERRGVKGDDSEEKGSDDDDDHTHSRKHCAIVPTSPPSLSTELAVVGAHRRRSSRCTDVARAVPIAYASVAAVAPM